MRKGFVVRQKGYEYNDNWYDHDQTQDTYTKLYDDYNTALKEAKKLTADFIDGRYLNDFFNNQPYLNKLFDIVCGVGVEGYGTEFKHYDIDDPEFNQIWELIQNDIATDNIPNYQRDIKIIQILG